MQTLEEIKKAFIEDSVDTSNKSKPDMKWWNNQHLGLREDEVKSFIEEKIKTNKSIIKGAYDFIKSNISEYSAQMIIGHAFSKKDSNGLHDITDDFIFLVSLYKNEKEKTEGSFKIPGKFTKDIVERQKDNNYVFFVSFTQFVFRVINARKIEKTNLAIEKIKAPNALLNTMLTDKSKTLQKLDRSISAIESALEKNKDESKKAQLEKQLNIANEIFAKCKNNFPDNFNFSVYEHYAIFGAFKLLTKSNFKPQEMYFTDILKALNFNFKSGDITRIKEAFKKLTQEKFPCYMIREVKGSPNKYDFYSEDEPIFKLRAVNRLDLNINLNNKEITKERLILSLENPSLIYDLENFYSLINTNILRDLREYKKRVQEVDLYFIEYIIKDRNFRNERKISWIKLCLTIKETSLLNEAKTNFKNRDKKRRFKDLIKNICEFLIDQNILKDFSMDTTNDLAIFKYKKEKSVVIR